MITTEFMWYSGTQFITVNEYTLAFQGTKFSLLQTMMTGCWILVRRTDLSTCVVEHLLQADNNDL